MMKVLAVVVASAFLLVCSSASLLDKLKEQYLEESLKEDDTEMKNNMLEEILKDTPLGQANENEPEECDDQDCINGRCFSDGCLCNDGWTGENCDEVQGMGLDTKMLEEILKGAPLGQANENEPEECDDQECINGRCFSDGCLCDDGWVGENCDEAEVQGMELDTKMLEEILKGAPLGQANENEPEECDDQDCINGRCFSDGCLCDDGWVGENCDEAEVQGMELDTKMLEEILKGAPLGQANGNEPEECDDQDCINGRCFSDGCLCDAGWTGENCDEAEVQGIGLDTKMLEEILKGASLGQANENEPEECDDQDCINGRCFSDGCLCDDGWTGENCDEVEMQDAPQEAENRMELLNALRSMLKE